MTNLEKSYETIIKERGLRELPYQRDFLTNPIYNNTTKPLVLAAGTSSGKTFMTLMMLQMFYLNPKNKNKRSLILSASTTILRNNFKTEMEWFNPSFSYCIVENKIDLENAIKNKCQVIVALPQSLNNNLGILPKVHKLILDEAHQWYFEKSIKDIINTTKPVEQLLLTGSPSKFIAKKNNFQFKFVPVMDLYDLNQVSNVKIEVVSSSYNFKNTDWLSSYGNLKSSKTNSKVEAKNALKVVCKEMIKKLKNPIKGLHSINNITGNTIGSLFNHLDKTIIYVHSLVQADEFHTTLNSERGLKDRVLCSHSENDKDSILFKQFKEDPNIKILIVVGRGRLGFNMAEMFNVIDFTLTQSLDMLLQMYGRLLRKSETNPKKQKIYFKVATKNTANYFVDLMTAMMCLTHMEWYSKFNGKNMGDIKIPKVLLKKVRRTIGGSTKSSTSNKPRVNITELGIPLDLNLFNENVLHSHSGKFDTIAYTTLGECRTIFFGITGIPYTKEKLIEVAKNSKKITDLGNTLNRKKGITINQFKDKCISSGNWYGYDGQKLFNDITKHIPKQFIWTKDNIIEDFKLNDYKTRSSFRTSQAGRAAVRLGIFDELIIELENNIKKLEIGAPYNDYSEGRIKWTNEKCIEIIKQFNSFNELKNDKLGRKAYNYVTHINNLDLSKKCFSHWENYYNGKRFEWNKDTEHLFWERVSKTNSTTKQDLRDNNLRGPAQKLGLWDNFSNREHTKLGNNQFIKK